MSEEFCKICNSSLIFTETPLMIHYGKLECPKCNKFIRWVTSPEKDGLRNKTSKYDIDSILRFHKYRSVFCFFCLRNKEELGLKETITRDHIQELDKGGNDEIENLQILCSACHKLKNWARLYMNWHVNKK